MDALEAAAVITSLGFGGGVVAVLNSWAQRRKVGADAASVVAAAARELLDPLRQSLADERAGRASDRSVAASHIEKLEAALDECTTATSRLVPELQVVRAELNVLRRQEGKRVRR